MKFGSQIKEGLYAEWEKYYIDYSGLKKFLKRRQAAHESKNESNIWDDADEAEFIKKLQDELTKVSRFQEEKVAELHGQIALYSEEVQELVNLQQQQKSGKAGGRQNNGGNAAAAGAASSSGQVAKLGDDEDDDDEDIDDDDLSTEAEETERRFTELEEDLEVLIADVYDLGRFTHLNYTGFIKIVKVRACILSRLSIEVGFKLTSFLTSFLLCNHRNTM
jgi:SPX domain protein involved in polyphosphate accumulation